jgi:hypothetical protein
MCHLTGCKLFSKVTIYYFFGLRDGPLLWKAFHNSGESYRVRETREINQK